jgi:hypothetical protein
LRSCTSSLLKTLLLVAVLASQQAWAVRLSPQSGEIALPVIGASLASSAGSAIIPATATAIAVNVTVVTPATSGFVTVYPCGVPRPLASNLNFVAGDVVPNGVIASIGSNGAVCFYSSGETDLVVDIAGWFEGAAYVGATPTRLVDTRDGTGGTIGRIGPSTPLTIPVANLAVNDAAGSSTTLPANVAAVALNVTAVQPSASGFITVWPCGERPLASNLNYVAGDIIPNGVIAPVSANGEVCLYSLAETHVIVDLAGWFPGEAFVGSTPDRQLDSRSGIGGRTTKLAPPDEQSVLISGIQLAIDGQATLVPSSARAAALNVTIVNPEGSGFATIWPCGITRPNASNLNFTAGQVVANNVIASLGSSGDICVYTNVPADVIVDASGWFSGEVSDSFVGVTPTRVIDTRINLGPAPGEEPDTGDSVGDGGESQTAEVFFNESIHDDIIQSSCVICHVQGGIAGATPLLYTNVESDNLELIRTYIATDPAAANRYLEKTRGVNHTGGAVLRSDSTEYLNLITFLNLLGAETTPSVLLGAFWESASLANPVETVRRASIIVRGAVPKSDEVPPLDADDETLRASLKVLLEGANFRDFLTNGANDRLHTDAFLNGLILEAADPNNVLIPVAANAVSQYDDRVPEQSVVKNELRHRFFTGMARAPLELIAHVVENDLPYTEILTADYTMVNPVVSDLLLSGASFETDNPWGFVPGQHRGQIKSDDQLVFDFQNNFGASIDEHSGFIDYPHAGVLNSQAFLNRYPSTETNRNRARARWTYYHFLGVDIERSATRTTDAEALADSNNPTINNPNCTVCHAVLDPMAGAFQNYDDAGFYRSSHGGFDSLPYSYKNPEAFSEDAEPSEYVEGDAWYRDMRTPGFDGASAPSPENSLQWLAQEIINDPRFATAAVKFWWPALMGTEVLIAPEVSTDQDYAEQLATFDAQNAFIESLGAAFATGIGSGTAYNLKDLLTEMMMSPWFRAKDLGAGSAAAVLSQVGTRRLLTPLELENKVYDILGWQWGMREDENLVRGIDTELVGTYGIYYGGIDSFGIQSRARDLTPLMFNVAERMAIRMACGTTVADFFSPNEERRLFFDITPGATPISQFSETFVVAGASVLESASYPASGRMIAGENRVTLYFMNDFYDEATQADRNLIVDRVTVTDSTGTAAFVLEMEDINTIPGAVIDCGAPHHSPAATDGPDAFLIWSSCVVSFPLTLAVTGDYAVNVEAYGQQAGPELIEMSVTVDSEDTENSTGAFLIKQKLVDLHQMMLGESLSIEDEEIQQSYQLLVETWEARIASEDTYRSWSYPDEDCFFPPEQHPDPWGEGGIAQLDRDVSGMKNTWTSIMIYLMTDYKFLHE